MAARRIIPLLGLAVAMLLPAVGAWADAIDGNWCHSDGRNMSIDGPQIVTPGGKRMAGNYDRHAFTFVAPKGEPKAGSTISMILIDDDTLNLTVGGGTAEPAQRKMQVWRRCDLTT